MSKHQAEIIKHQKAYFNKWNERRVCMWMMDSGEYIDTRELYGLVKMGYFTTSHGPMNHTDFFITDKGLQVA